MPNLPLPGDAQLPLKICGQRLCVWPRQNRTDRYGNPVRPTLHLHLHAEVNKTNGGAAFKAGADQYRATLTFTVRYTRSLEDLANGPQPFRILYRGRTYKLVDYDDYMERHRDVKLTGELYG
jgi:SPP1 family predicted phage head-tail adaptor